MSKSSYGGYLLKRFSSFIPLFALFGVTTVVASLIAGSASNPVSATNGTASATSDVTVNVAEIISLRIIEGTATSDASTLSDLSNLVLSLNPTPNGAFTRGSFIAEASTSNATGYKLYLTSLGQNHAGSYTTSLINTDTTIDDTTSTSIGNIPTLDFSSTPGTNSITEAQFRVNNSNYKNRWGYSTNGLIITSTTNNNITTNAVAENTDTSVVTYQDIPAHTESREIDDKTTATEQGLTPVTIGANVTNAKASGTYQNELELTAIASELPIDYSITFNSNTDGAGGETGVVSDKPANLSASSMATSYTFTLPDGTANIPVKTGMVLKEWNTQPDGGGTSYQPGDSVTLVADDANPMGTIATLYAIWTADFFSIDNMQDMYPTVCAKLYTPSNAIGTNVTAITRSKDSISSVSGAGSTQVASDYAAYKAIVTANSTRDGENQPNVAQATLYDIRDSKPYTVRKLADGNCWMTSNLNYQLAAGVQAQGSSNTSRTAYPFTPTSCGSDGACSMNGNTVASGAYYYSWYAATAETGTSSDINVDTSASICPIGWRLPANYTIDSTKSYGSLTNAYNLTSGGANNSQNHVSELESSPLNFARSGNYGGGSLNYNGTYGIYWSSTAYSSSAVAYSFYYDASYTYPQGNSSKYGGFSVRCVAQ